MNAPAFEPHDLSPSRHFQLCYFSAVLRLICYLRETEEGEEEAALERVIEKFPFTAAYLMELRRFVPDDLTWDAAADWWDGEISRAESGAAEHLPLAALSRHGIDARSRLALMLAGLVEEDSRFGAVYGSRQGGERRPTIETIGHVLALEAGSDGWGLCRPLISAGLLEVLNEQAPRSEWVVRVPSVLWDAARGESDAQPGGFRHHAVAELPRLDDLILDAGFRSRLRQVAPLLQRNGAHTVVVRGTPGSDRLQVLQSLARELGSGTVEIPAALATDRRAQLAGPLSALSGSLPLVVWDAAPGETLDLPLLPGYQGPIGVAMGLEGGLAGWAAERAITLTIPDPRPEDRRRHWQAAAGDRPVRDLAAISERFHLPGGYIRQAAGSAAANAALDGRDSIGFEDVRAACRVMNRQLLDTLATRLEADAGWGHLVVSDAAMLKLRELERRCRHRERLLDRLGPGFTGRNRGVRALFTGPSGTGKTLAARILAGPSVLGMDLYRVDLAAIVNKYIGETEKNLHRVLSRAEELDVVLLVDEGDALLGQRTEVKSANDRYANLETNYLLQRLETYQGVIIVTTNAGENIDTAFQRRMDVVVNFVPPQAAERWRIWRLHLPPGHAVEESFLDEIAQRCVLSGGQIRNAALHATLLSLDEGTGVRRSHVMRAIESEYRKAGATSSLGATIKPASSESSIRGFINALSA